MVMCFKRLNRHNLVMSESSSTPTLTQHPNRFVLAVDLDGVCADYLNSLRPYMAAMGRKDAFELPEPGSWDLVAAGWFDSTEDYVRTHRYAVDRALFRTMDELPGMSNALWELSDAEVHIRIVTHRFLSHGDQDRAAGDTIAWLQSKREDGRVRVPHRDLCFLGAKADASADLHIDDAPYQVEALRDSGQNVLVFDQPYNKELAGPRATGWGEVVTKVLAAQKLWLTQQP
jgi:5'(3')-deoxyribonucleotidase